MSADYRQLRLELLDRLPTLVTLEHSDNALPDLLSLALELFVEVVENLDLLKRAFFVVFYCLLLLFFLQLLLLVLESVVVLELGEFEMQLSLAG